MQNGWQRKSEEINPPIVAKVSSRTRNRKQTNTHQKKLELDVKVNDRPLIVLSEPEG